MEFQNRPWHALSWEDALKSLGSSPEGLSDGEYSDRFTRFGPNKLPEAKRAGLFLVFLRQFKNPLIYILLAAAVVSIGVGAVGDAMFIFAVLLINSIIGTIQEWKAETSAEALKSIMRVMAHVRRNGGRREVDATQLVPGDIVLLESGAAVPADIRLLSTHTLRVDESLLTGESLPVRKDAETILSEGSTVADRINLLHAGTSVLDGRAVGVVCRTGSATEVGKIAESLALEAAKPPLVIRLEQLTRTIAFVITIGVAILSAVQLARGIPFVDIFLFAVALAVSAIPEGLPVAITVALAMGMQRMARRHVIIRLLPAVEGLGACTLIASDKTGTLTANQLTIKRVAGPQLEPVEVMGEGLDPCGAIVRAGEPVTDQSVRHRLERAALTGALCNEGEFRLEDGTPFKVGDAVDVAFLVFAAKLGHTQKALNAHYPQIGSIPFEPKHRFAASFNRHGDQVMAHVKGAAETVLGMCRDVDRDAIEAQHQALAEEGYRVLAVATGRVSEQLAKAKNPDSLKNLEILGLVGLIDPIRAGVPEALQACHRAGVQVRMITGDHPVTGRAIACQLGLVSGEPDVMTGSEIIQLASDEPRLHERISQAAVFARVEPAQKTDIVNALQKAGHFVAMTGDGVNDAPALKAANIGVAMGQAGTDVARGAADLILTDDNFASIVNGIEEGRIAYANVRKVTWLLISTGAAELVLFFLALGTGLPLPLDPVQLLWLNLVTNGFQDVALAFEKGEPGLLDRPPRPPDEPIFNRLMIEENVLSGAYMGLVAFGTFAWLFKYTTLTEFEASNILLLLMVLFENAQVFNCRSEFQSAFKVPLRANPLLIGAVILAQGVHITSMYIPGINDVLEIEPVSFETWAVLLGLASTLIVVMELYKRFRADSLTRGPSAHQGPEEGKPERCPLS